MEPAAPPTEPTSALSIRPACSSAFNLPRIKRSVTGLLANARGVAGFSALLLNPLNVSSVASLACSSAFNLPRIKPPLACTLHVGLLANARGVDGFNALLLNPLSVSSLASLTCSSAPRRSLIKLPCRLRTLGAFSVLCVSCCPPSCTAALLILAVNSDAWIISASTSMNMLSLLETRSIAH